MYSLMANCFDWIRRRKEPNRAVTLVIIGLDDAGKTTMVASLQGEPPDGITPTIGFANAEFTIDRCKVTVYDLGGGVRIRDVWRKYYAEVFGVVFVLDSCSVDRLDETKEVFQQVLENAKVLGKPFLIFANKQDKAGALPAEDISSALDLESSKYTFPYKVFTCSALKGYGRGVDKNINAGFQWLLNTISGEFGKISARVEHDVAIQREEEEREKKARLERIRKIREERDRLEREAGNDPDKEDSDDEVMMANPFQPIGKHLENMKSKERRKKLEKEKKQKADQGKIEMESKDEKGLTDPTVIKKKRKKKKKIPKPQEEEEDAKVDESNEGNAGSMVDGEDRKEENVQHSYDEDTGLTVKKKKKKKKVMKLREDNDMPHNGVNKMPTSSMVDGEEHFVEDQHSTQDEDNNIVIKKKKKKTKVKVVQELEKNVSGEEESLNVSPTIKKHKKKKKILTTLEEDYVEPKNEVQSEMRFRSEFRQEEIDSAIVENGETIDTLETVKVRKPKMKKRKKKKNKTVPMDHVTEEETASNSLPAPVWKSPPSNWTSLPPIGNNGEASNYGGLPPLRSNKTKKALGEASMQQLPSSPSWARTRPNSEDYDLVT